MIKSAIFDIDGTLLDSFESNLAFIRELMKAKGYRPQTREEYLPLFHTSLWDVIKKLTGLADDREIQKIWDFAHTAADLKTKSAPMPDGAAETIKTLSGQYSLAIATSRIKTYIYEPPLDTLQPYFKVAVGYEDTINHKPHPEPLLLAAEKLGAAPRECVYIGDAETDFIAARAAGMKFLRYGKEQFEGADASTSDFRAIPELLKNL